MWGARILREVGLAIDQRYIRKVAAKPVPGSELELLLVCFHPYHGAIPLKLSEHLLIQPGEIIAEFHLANRRVMEIAAETEYSLQWRLIEMIKLEFQTLAAACLAGEIPETVKAFYGVNVLAAGARRLGFTMVSIPRGWQRWWLGFWESCLRLIFYSFKTKKKAALKRTMDPYEIWITREDLIIRYPQKS